MFIVLFFFCNIQNYHLILNGENCFIPNTNHVYTLQVCLEELTGRWKIKISQAYFQVKIQTLLAINRQTQHLTFYLVIGLIDKVLKLSLIQNIPDIFSSYDLKRLFQLHKYSQILRRPQGQILSTLPLNLEIIILKKYFFL